eukprot:456538-Hanusia_phi.AAC.1
MKRGVGEKKGEETEKRGKERRGDASFQRTPARTRRCDHDCNGQEHIVNDCCLQDFKELLQGTNEALGVLQC